MRNLTFGFVGIGLIGGSVAKDAADFSAMPQGAVTSAVSEAMEALMVLGYSQGEVAPILGKLDQSLDTQDLIKETLRIMAAK